MHTVECRLKRTRRLLKRTISSPSGLQGSPRQIRQDRCEVVDAIKAQGPAGTSSPQLTFNLSERGQAVKGHGMASWHKPDVL